MCCYSVAFVYKAEVDRENLEILRHLWLLQTAYRQYFSCQFGSTPLSWLN